MPENNNNDDLVKWCKSAFKNGGAVSIRALNYKEGVVARTVTLLEAEGYTIEIEEQGSRTLLKPRKLCLSSR